MLGVLSMPELAVGELHIHTDNEKECDRILNKRLDEITKDELTDYAGFGNAVASLCVEKRGAIPAMPDLFQVEERMGKRELI